jgi:nucleoid-associated protein YgaU
MIPLRILAPSVFAFAFVSCASQKADQYDTVPPRPANQVTPPATAAANPVYDTPAAYEESGTTAATTSANPPIAPYNPEPDAHTPSAPTAPAAPRPPAAPSNGAAIIHTVVAGDTLSGISAKYKVPTAAIKQANNMKNDTVVLGRKMVIPPVR